MMIEACAGLLDNDNPEDCIRRESEEETGYKISHVEKIFEAYMSPGSVTEILHFFIAEYSEELKSMAAADWLTKGRTSKCWKLLLEMRWK